MLFYDSGVKETECLLTDEEIKALKKKYKTYDTVDRLKKINSPEWIAEHDGISIEEAKEYIEQVNAIDNEPTEEEKEARKERVKKNKEKLANKCTSEENLKYTYDILKEKMIDKEFTSKDCGLIIDKFNCRQLPHQLRALEKQGKLIHTKTEKNRKYYRLKG